MSLLRQGTDDSESGVTMNLGDASHILEVASEKGIVTPIPNNITQNDFGLLEIIVQLTKKDTRSGDGSLTMIVQNGKYNELEFHRTTRYTELKTLANSIDEKNRVALAFPGSLCDKTSTYSKKCTRTRTYNIQEYFNNVINVYHSYIWKAKDKFLEFLQDKTKWRVLIRDTYEGGGNKTRKRNRKRGKKTSKRRRKGGKKTRKRRRSLKKRRGGRKRRKRTKSRR